MDRRLLLKAISLSPLWLQFHPQLALAKSAPAKRTLILLELAGGNDGLNTYIPYLDPLYKQLRPKLAIASKDIRTITPTLGLHPALKPLEKYWEDGELALVQGLGYADPNRSHFRSVDIWHTASDSNQYSDRGWLSQVLPATQANSELQAIVLGNRIGPCLGGELNFVALHRPERWLKREQPEWPAPDSGNPALDHLLKVQQRQSQAAEALKKQLSKTAKFSAEFPKTAFGQQCHLVSKMLASGIQPRVIKLTLTGFDTHAGQLRRHQQLLSQMANGLAPMISVLQQIGLWQQVAIVTYSEFGRRVAENGSGGTDHGAAATHLVLGGKLTGGLYGVQPGLDNLERGDLRFTTDFRRLYHDASLWIGGQGLTAHQPLGLFAI